MNPEKAPLSPERKTEQARSPEQVTSRERMTEALEREGEQQAEKQPERAEAARHDIEQMPEGAETTQQVKKEVPYTPYARSQSKKSQYKQSLKRIQDQLPSKRSKTFSRFIHRPAVETVSEVAGKTVFRPSITLGASLGALLGGSLFYFAARHYGFQLSGTEFVLFGAIGAGLGIILEALSALLKKLFTHSQR